MDDQLVLQCGISLLPRLTCSERTTFLHSIFLPNTMLFLCLFGQLQL